MKDIATQRADIIDALDGALVQLESGESLSNFVEGHGLNSGFFRLHWDEPTLRIDFELPYACVLQDTEDLADDDNEISASIRMAILLLIAAGNGTLLQNGEARLSVFNDGDSIGWTVYGTDEDILDDADDWDSLAARLENAVPVDDKNSKSIIWP